MTSLERAKKIARILDDKKAADIKLIQIAGLTTIGDYFVVATGGSTTQVKSLCDDVEELMEKEEDCPLKRIEGYNTASWILLDYYDVIVHIFLKETREFYALERLWSDAPVIALDE